MKISFADRLFVVLVFSLAYIALTHDVSITGNSIAVPTAGDFLEQEEIFVPALSTAASDAKKVFFSLDGYVNLQASGISAGSIIYAKSGENTYGITVLRITQDYGASQEYASILITPGSKRLTLSEGQTILVDFNNDGVDDVSVTLKSVSYGEATFQITTA